MYDLEGDEGPGRQGEVATEPGALDSAVLVEQVEDSFDAVDRALARLDDGTYGRCEGCGAALDDAALAADPTAARCPAHVPLPGAREGSSPAASAGGQPSSSSGSIDFAMR